MKSIGLVGCGNWGSNILRDLVRLNGRVTVLDINAQARQRATELGAVTVTDRWEQLPDSDGYVVAVPIPDLTPVCAQLLARRKPIFAEKTLCRSLADGDQLERLGGGEFIFAMHKWHYHPGIEALRQLAASGRLGLIEELQATRHGWVPDYHGGDVFWTLAVHDLTIVKHILGAIPATIRSATVIRNAAGLPVNLTAVLGEKPTVLLSVNGQHCNKLSAVSIHGSRGSASLPNAYADHILVRDAGGEEKISIDTTFPLYLELKEFVEYLGGGPRPRCGLREAREVTASLLELRKTAGLGPAANC